MLLLSSVWPATWNLAAFGAVQLIFLLLARFNWCFGRDLIWRSVGKNGPALKGNMGIWWSILIQHKRNRRAVDRANMSSDYQKERPPENQGRQINTTAHKHWPMCEQLGFGRLARIVKDTQFDPRGLRRNVNIRRPGMGSLAAFHSPQTPTSMDGQECTKCYTCLWLAM